MRARTCIAGRVRGSRASRRSSDSRPGAEYMGVSKSGCTTNAPSSRSCASSSRLEPSILNFEPSLGYIYIYI